jgi:hypothetical protein
VHTISSGSHLFNLAGRNQHSIDSETDVAFGEFNDWLGLSLLLTLIWCQ